MSSASSPTRRVVLSQVLAAGIVPVAATGPANHKVGSTRSQRDEFFDRCMVRGPSPIKTANPLSFSLAGQNRELLVRVTYPDPSSASAGTQFPVVLFSHDALSSKDLYNPIIELWASHGIVTILPSHIDSESLGHKPEQMDQPGVLVSRIGDMTYLLDHLDEIAMQVPELPGHIDKERIGVGGHGFGSMVAFVMAGLHLKPPAQSAGKDRDPRMKALICYNGDGPLPFLGDNWGDITMPVFAATGTADPGASDSDAEHSWRWRLSSFSLTSGKSRYGVSVTLGDHSYGGLICDKTQGEKPDATGLDIVNAMSTAFIAAYLAGNKEAATFLKTCDLPSLTDGRAFLERS